MDVSFLGCLLSVHSRLLLVTLDEKADWYLALNWPKVRRLRLITPCLEQPFIYGGLLSIFLLNIYHFFCSRIIPAFLCAQGQFSAGTHSAGKAILDDPTGKEMAFLEMAYLYNIPLQDTFWRMNLLALGLETINGNMETQK